ncbi:MAG: keto-deoxy-phosphogluconate aldolase [Verrucomicrobia bacterium 61-8]|nr:bifunctional 4-hydroxy-2-oxoglutarate aldolase/2-dehydro-3-deoxy-phosphogluconate aldolase [Verrucomicrobiota bacterium]OJV25371.1 MAG: keto-deoxy-phosphogluconate aldolase [Verrucomicrobia bacterium 61-8]
MNPPVLFSESLLQRIRKARIIAVVVIDEVADAQPLSETLMEAGITAIELTLRTPNALDSLCAIRRHCPDMLAGVGTVLFPEQARLAVAGEAAFAVAPGLNPDVVRAAQMARLPFAPGIMTPSDIECAVQLGCRLLKLFPAEASGGVGFLNSIAAPYTHLDLQFIPLGGLNESNFTSYLALENVPAIGGSWIAPRDLIRKNDWPTIRENARRAVAKLS